MKVVGFGGAPRLHERLADRRQSAVASDTDLRPKEGGRPVRSTTQAAAGHPASVQAAGSSGLPAETVTHLVARANQWIQTHSPQLEFSVTNDPHAVVARLVDRESGEVVREFPVIESSVFDEPGPWPVSGGLLHVVA